MFFKWFDSFMTKHQRKLVLVDVYGNEIMHRYCILRKEKTDETIFTRTKMPALYVHHFLWRDSPDGPSSHSHVGSTFSFILKGGYKERYRGKLIDRKRFSVNRVIWPETHKIESVTPGTWTIFYRGFVKSNDVRIVPESCENVCDYCKTNYGKCFNVGREFSYLDYKKQFDSTKENAYKFPTWFYAGPTTDRLISRRRLAIRRLGVEAPVGTQAQLAVGQKHSKLPLIIKEKETAGHG